MSDFNPLDRAKVAVHRSSFDLSSKKLFTAKVGEILPCYWQIAIPNNKYRISSDWFTRTVPVTAITDFPQPAFDQLGMQPVPALNLHNNPSRSVSGALGYNLRYWQWKTNIDTVHAAFRSGMAYQSWSLLS